MKRAIVFTCVLTLCLLCGCGQKDTSSEVVQLNKNMLELYVGQSERLEVSGADEIEWNSDDSSVARVFYGAVTGMSVGETVITATADGKVFECKVIVLENKGEVLDSTSDTKNNNDTSTESSKPQKIIDDKVVSAAQSNVQDSVKNEGINYEEEFRKAYQAEIDNIFDKIIEEHIAECNAEIAKKQAELSQLTEKISNLDDREKKEYLIVYGDKKRELEKEIERMIQVREDGIAAHNRVREEEKANWRDRMSESE